MLSRDEIILMIEQMDTAAADAQREIDHSIELLTESDDVTAVAAVQQLRRRSLTESWYRAEE